jgi:excisionase family DNA binding protein
VQEIGSGKFGYSVVDSDRETPAGGARLASEPTYLKSKKQAAAYLNISVSCLEQLMRSGLAFVRLGKGNIRFRPEDLAEYIERRRVQLSGDQEAR